ncbi:hypothetical protein MKEN_00941200 [Mycena kentingensis (nom. inval.)]|nr:hypothetical protein MKEN_00941200 [Mycena kentingensis (nom. inval.)]
MIYALFPRTQPQTHTALPHVSSSFVSFPSREMLEVMPLTPDLSEPDSDRDSFQPQRTTRAQLASPIRPSRSTIPAARPVPKLFGDLQLDQDRLHAVLGTTVAPVGTQRGRQPLPHGGLPHPVLAGISRYLEAMPASAPPLSAAVWQQSEITATLAEHYVTRLEEIFGPGDVLRGEEEPPGVWPCEEDSDWQSSPASSRETSVGTESRSTHAPTLKRRRAESNSHPPPPAPILGTELERRLIAQMDAIVKGKRTLTREACAAAIESMRALKEMLSDREAMYISDPRGFLFDAETLRKSFWKVVEAPPNELGVGFDHEIIAMQKWARWLLQKWWPVV